MFWISGSRLSSPLPEGQIILFTYLSECWQDDTSSGHDMWGHQTPGHDHKDGENYFIIVPGSSTWWQCYVNICQQDGEKKYFKSFNWEDVMIILHLSDLKICRKYL